MRLIRLYRHWQDHNQTFGTFVVFNEKKMPIFSSACVERGWRNNKKNESCVPVGTYPITWERSPRFNMMLWELKEVPNRAECKVHPANTWQQLNGCIALGIKLKDINKDGYIDVTDSKPTLALFHRAMGFEIDSKITIVNAF